MKPSTCRLTLLGPPTLIVDGRHIPLDRRKPLALLAYVAVEGATPRARIAALLWPELSAADARRNLRRELARLREMGAGAVLSADDERIDLHDAVDCDIRQLERGTAEAAPCPPLADGLGLGDAGGFDDWLQSARDKVARRWRALILLHAQAAEASDAHSEALRLYELLHAADPLREVTVVDLIRVHAARGQRSAALQVFDRFATRLQAELGLAPLPTTSAAAAALRTGAGAMAPTALAPAPEPAPVRAELARGALPRQMPFVGRASEVDAVLRAWRAGQVVLLAGEAGEGKTRLATDLAGMRGAFLHVACRPADREVPFAAAARLLRELLAAGDAAVLDASLRAELASLLPELGNAEPLTSAAARDQFAAAYARAVALLADANFATVIVDDLHNADGAARALLLAAAQQASDAGGHLPWLFGLRGSELSADTADVLAALVHSGAARSIALTPLPAAAVGELIRMLSGAEAPRFAARLTQATGGNPFFLSETLHHLIEQALVQVDAGGRWHTRFDESTADYRELPVPATVRDAVRARVARLGEATMRLLEAASLLGDPFAVRWLEGATSLDESERVLALESAEQSGLISVDRSGHYRFAHDLVPQSLAAGLSPARATVLHRRLATTLDALHGTDAALAPRIARHWRAAGEPRRAVRFHLAAAEAAARLFAHSEALAEFELALTGGPDTATEIRIRHGRIEALRHLGDVSARNTEAEALAQLAHAHGDRNLEANACMQRALALSDANRRREALRVLQYAVSLQPTDEPTLLRALRITGWAAVTCGETALAVDYVQRALPLAERIDASAAVSLISTLLRLASDRGDYDEGRRLFASARAHPALTVRPFIEYQVLTDGARLMEALGNRTEALRLQREGLALAERIGAAPNLLVGRFNLMRMLLNAGEVEAARPLAEGFAPLAAQTSHSQHQYVGLSALAQQAAAEERWDDAVAAGERAIALCDSLHDTLQSRMERVMLARVHLARGAFAQARERARESQQIDPDGRLLLSARVIELDAEQALDPAAAAGCLAALDQALAADVLPEEERQAGLCHAHLLRARLLLDVGQTDAAAAAAARVYFTPALRADALALALRAGAAVDGEARALLDSDRLGTSVRARLAATLAGA